MAITAQLGSIIFGGPADSDGDRFTLRDLQGWASPPADLILVERPITAGAVAVRGRWKARTIVIVGHGIAPNAAGVWRIRNKLGTEADTALYDDDVLLTVTEPGPVVYTVGVRLAEGVKDRPAGPRALEFEITLVAPDPTKTLVTP